MEINQSEFIDYFEEVSIKNKNSSFFQDQFDFCITGKVGNFRNNKAGGVLDLILKEDNFSVYFEFADIYYLSKTEAESLLKAGRLIKIYGQNNLADWQNKMMVASYIEGFN